MNSAPFVTFYSCKGGVGRSMALINVAGILAGRGFRVLALDMDLEAPGISYLMRHEVGKSARKKKGFVDLLDDACRRGPEADLFALDPKAVVERYSYAYTVPEPIRKGDDGLLRIMPAGLLDDGYQARLDGLQLGQLYREGSGQPLLAAFKQVIQASEMFDLVFVDSRTGFSDEAGICTRDLADHLVVVMGLNRQNVDGTAAFLRSLRQAGVERTFRVVFSPVPTGEDELVDERERDAARALAEAWGSPIQLGLEIPYHPRLALTEEPHIFRRSRGQLFEAYQALHDAVTGLVGLSADALNAKLDAAVAAQDGEAAQEILVWLRKVGGEVGNPRALEELALRPKEARLRTAYARESSGVRLERFAAAVAVRALPEIVEIRRLLLAENPNDPGTRRALAVALAEWGDASQAETELRRILEFDPSPPTNYSLGWLLWRRTSDLAGAAQFLRRAAEVERFHHSFAIFTLEALGDLPAARALAVKPAASVAGKLNRARIRYLSRQPKGGMDDLKASVRGVAYTPIRMRFYLLAYAYSVAEFNPLPNLRRLLLDRERLPMGLPFDATVRHAIELGHPEPELLRALARVIADGAPVAILDELEAWRNAPIAEEPPPEPME